jgi:hypothetical protein
LTKPRKKADAATPQDASQVAAECRQQIVDNAAEITEALIKSAGRGSYQAAKFLFEFAGLMQPPVASSTEPHPGEIVLAELKRLLAEAPALTE